MVQESAAANVQLGLAEIKDSGKAQRNLYLAARALLGHVLRDTRVLRAGSWPSHRTPGEHDRTIPAYGGRCALGDWVMLRRMEYRTRRYCELSR